MMGLLQAGLILGKLSGFITIGWLWIFTPLILVVVSAIILAFIISTLPEDRQEEVIEKINKRFKDRD